VVGLSKVWAAIASSREWAAKLLRNGDRLGHPRCDNLDCNRSEALPCSMYSQASVSPQCPGELSVAAKVEGGNAQDPEPWRLEEVDNLVGAVNGYSGTACH
jgi:hypothetical protein